jgi:glucokinase
MTLGTGFGAGIVSNGELLQGDNMSAAEIWITSNRANPEYNSEEGISIRAVKYFFSKFSEIPFSDCPEPKEIYFMATDENNKYSIAAQKAFYELGRYLGDAIANIITLTDGIVVIGGGIAGAKKFIIPGIKHELNREFKKLDGRTNKRLTHKVYCLNNERELTNFLQDDKKLISVPYFDNINLEYYHIPKAAYMFSNFDTSEMISLGAYFFAEKQLKKTNT